MELFMARLKKLLAEYDVEVSEISEEVYNNSERGEVLDLTCQCGVVYYSKKQQVARRLAKGVRLKCRSCVNKENRNGKDSKHDANG